MGTRHLLVIVAVAGCYRGSATPSDMLSNSTAQPPGVFTISAEKFGPLDAHSRRR